MSDYAVQVNRACQAHDERLLDLAERIEDVVLRRSAEISEKLHRGPSPEIEDDIIELLANARNDRGDELRKLIRESAFGVGHYIDRESIGLSWSCLIDGCIREMAEVGAREIAERELESEEVA